MDGKGEDSKRLRLGMPTIVHTATTESDESELDISGVSKTGARPDATDPRRRIQSGRTRRTREVELLQSAASGDDTAATFLFNQHVDVVFRAAARVLGTGHPDLDDVVQTVFLSAFAQAEQYEGRSRLSTWLVGIAIRKSIDAVRASERRARWRRMKEWVGVVSSAPIDPLQRLETLSEAERQLSKLSLEQRAVFVLVEIEQYTLKEASEMLETGLSTLHARLQAARKLLRESEAP